jgi:hypothetical protein
MYVLVFNMPVNDSASFYLDAEFFELVNVNKGLGFQC